MKTINRYLYNIIFWISRVFSIFVFGICLSIILHAKYIFCEKIFYILFNFLFEYVVSVYPNIKIANINIEVLGISSLLFDNFCKNSQSIDLLIIALILILVISIILIRYVNKGYEYLLTVSIISSISYLIMYTIFKLPIMIALAVSTPIILLSIYILNKRCPIQEVIVLIPIVGEIFCTKKIIQYIFKNSSDKIANFSLLLIALIVSNVICFLFPYKTEKDFENRIMKNETYSIRIYGDEMIISGGENEVIINKNGEYTYVKNDKFSCLQDFIINENKKEIYVHNYSDGMLLILDITNLNLINKINTFSGDASRSYCDDDFSKLLVVFEYSDIGCVIDLNLQCTKYIKNISFPRDDLIYNKYRNCFLLSFHDDKAFLEEINIDTRKIRKIKANKYQGYIAISERNKEIYIAFHQQGVIGVYDAESMKLKRRIKSNYTVKNITYDKELNVLIAPSYFTGYVDIFLMDGSDKLLTREFVGYELREGCFDPQKENLYVCSSNGLYRKKINIKNLIKEYFNVSHETKN